MGYYTSFSLTLDGASETEEAKIVRRLKEMGIIGIILDEDLGPHDLARWYDHDVDLLQLSLEFPNVRFDLYGDGEDAEDLWETHYLNGKMQVCMAQIPSYAPEKLETVPELMEKVEKRLRGEAEI